MAVMVVAAHPAEARAARARRVWARRSRRAAGAGRAESPEARLAALAHGGGALRRGLAALAGCMVRRRAWEPLGFARVGDYARERLGLSGRELRDLAHVDARLAGLPALERALVEGALPWTKVRLLCRVATPADEASWIALAASLGPDALEREVRRGDAAAEDGAEDDEPYERVRIPCDPTARALWWHACRLAQRKAGQPLLREACAERIAAEVLSALPLGGDGGPPDAGSGTGLPRARPRTPAGLQRRAGPSVPVPVAAELEGCTPVELDRRLRRAVRREQGRLAEVARLLLWVRGEGAYRDLGFRSFAEYARGRLAMAPSRAHALVRVARVGALLGAFARGRLSFAQAEALVPLAYEPGGRRVLGGWIARAGQVTVARLGEDVGWALARGELDPAGLPALPAPLALSVGEAAVPGRTGRVEVAFGAPRSLARLFLATLGTVQRRIERIEGRGSSPGEALEAMAGYVLGLWGREGCVPRAYRVFVRDGWRCTAPGCTSYRNLQDHHVVFRSRGGGDELENRVTLCAYHHLRGVHAGRLSVTGRAPEHLRYRTLLGEWKAGGRVVGAA